MGGTDSREPRSSRFGMLLSGVVLLVFASVSAVPAADEDHIACVASTCFATLQEALDQAADGDTIVISPGRYEQAAVLRLNGITLVGQDVHLTGRAVEEKAALVIKGDDVTVEGIEVSNVRVPDGNGAAIRQEGRNLTLRRVHLHNNEIGIMSERDTGILRIEDSLLEDNGYPGAALGHNIYAQGDELRFVRSRSLRARNEGHEIKSRAGRTIIEESVIASLDSRDSRCIDVPNSGEILIRNNLIQMGPYSSNEDLIGIGLEGRPQHEPRTAVIRDNTFVLDDVFLFRLVHHRGMERVVVEDNVIVSRVDQRLAGNRWFRSREAAGLPPYPSLPAPPSDGSR